MPTTTALYADAKVYDTPEVWPLNLSSDEARDWMVITFGYFFLTSFLAGFFASAMEVSLLLP